MGDEVREKDLLAVEASQVKRGTPIWSSLLLNDVVVSEDVIHYGYFGELLEAEWMHTPCAARVAGKVNEDLISTVELWRRLRHPAIVSLLGLYEVGGAVSVWMVTERLAANLKVLLETRPKSQFPLSVKSTILYDISSALYYLHSLEPPVPFGDLKADHVYVSEDLRGKLDLGVKITGSEFHTYDNQLEPYNASISYHVPPDFFEPPSRKLREKNLTLSATKDAFSFGVLCLHTLIQETPVPSVQPLQLSSSDDDMVVLYSEEARRMMYLKKLEGKDKLFLPLIKNCLKTESADRPRLDVIHKEISQLTEQLSIGHLHNVFEISEALENTVQGIAANNKTMMDIQEHLRSLLALPKDINIPVPNTPPLMSRHRPRAKAISECNLKCSFPKTKKVSTLPPQYRSQTGRHQLAVDNNYHQLMSVKEEDSDSESDVSMTRL